MFQGSQNLGTNIYLSNVKRGLVFCIGFFVAGLSVGFVTSQTIGRRSLDKFAADSLASDISTTLVSLNRLRDGLSTNVIDYLEIRLDGDLVNLDDILERSIALRRETLEHKAIRTAKVYRGAFPHQPESQGVGEKIADLFQIVDNK